METQIQRKKIEETVIQILKEANLEEVTEFKVRVAAACQLGIDLTNIEHKKLVRGLIESFLLSTSDTVTETFKEGNDDATAREDIEKVVKEEEHDKEMDSNGLRIICKLSNKRNVAIQDFRGKPYISIREFYQKNGKQVPSNKGITLTNEQWSAFKNNVPAIEEAIMKMQSKLRSDPDGEKSEHISNSVTASTPELLPVVVKRFDGKNYRCWATQMDSFLKQLKIAYVLSEPCPIVAIRPEASTGEISPVKAAERKWLNDDCMCRLNILNSLSDSLYYQYSKKITSAKELWEELKFVYLYEDFGTKRSQVKRYIEFQMADEKPILNQVLELNSIADSIVAAGIFLDENFHVSAIISKLPPSWKDFCIKLAHEEHLPFWRLMDRVRVEEESRNLDKKGGESSNSLQFHHANGLGPRMMRDMRKPGMQWKRRETETDNKTFVCNYCGKKGHLSKYCRNKRFDDEANEK